MGIRITARKTLVAGFAVAFSTLPSIAEEPPPTPVPSVGAKIGEVPTRTPIVIDNETLRKYADQGRVTTVETQPSRVSGGTDLVGGFGTRTNGDEAAKRRYWRETYEQQLALVRSLERQIEILDREIPGLWRDFYARDDPMYRDGVIKPKLDEALARRSQMEGQLEAEREKLPKIRDAARRDGAQPGWFRGLDEPPIPPKEDTEGSPATRLPSDFDVEVVGADDT